MKHMKRLSRVALCLLPIVAIASCSSSISPLTILSHDEGSQTLASLSSETRLAEINRERVASLSSEPVPSATGQRASSKFPNAVLIDQHGRQLKFYDDIVKDHPVCVNVFYTRCQGSCPGTTQKMRSLRHRLKDEFGSEMRFISLSLEPDVDTPKELQDYMTLFEIENDPALPEWLFLTGQPEDIESLRRAFGLYELDPELDRDKTQHAATLTFGNDRTNRWAALPVGSSMDDLVTTITRITGNTNRQRFGQTVLLSSLDSDVSELSTTCLSPTNSTKNKCRCQK